MAIGAWFSGFAVGAAAVGLAITSVGAIGATKSSPASSGQEPPACAAISFRPLVSGLADGEQDAGLYKSRFAKIEIKATVKTGEAQNYYMVLNGKKAEPLAGGAPKSSEQCLKSKNIGVPVKVQNNACTGSRFRVVIDSSGNQKTAMLFGLQGNSWLFCNAAKLS